MLRATKAKHKMMFTVLYMHGNMLHLFNCYQLKKLYTHCVSMQANESVRMSYGLHRRKTARSYAICTKLSSLCNCVSWLKM